jgi:signal transduction histidine kinase
MRLTLEAMSPEDNDFLQAWSNFRFRWQQVLEGAGLESSWPTETQAAFVELAPHVILQLLRIVQEALTNVLKHAGARAVSVRLHACEQCIRIDVSDDGRGLRNAAAGTGRGVANMRARALRVGARLELTDLDPGLRLSIDYRRQRVPVT